MQTSAREVPHGGRAPAKQVRDAELFHQLKGRVVRLAYEMVEAFDRQAIEVEMRSHASGLGSRLEHLHFVPRLQRVVSGSEAHRTGADDDQSRHEESAGVQNLRTICEYTG